MQVEAAQTVARLCLDFPDIYIGKLGFFILIIFKSAFRWQGFNYFSMESLDSCFLITQAVIVDLELDPWSSVLLERYIIISISISKRTCNRCIKSHKKKKNSYVYLAVIYTYLGFYIAGVGFLCNGWKLLRQLLLHQKKKYCSFFGILIAWVPYPVGRTVRPAIIIQKKNWIISFIQNLLRGKKLGGCLASLLWRMLKLEEFFQDQERIDLAAAALSGKFPLGAFSEHRWGILTENLKPEQCNSDFSPLFSGNRGERTERSPVRGGSSSSSRGAKPSHFEQS